MKPKVICHMMGSVDGRLLNQRWSAPFDGTDISAFGSLYAACAQELQTDAWMFGPRTVQEGYLPRRFFAQRVPVAQPEPWKAPDAGGRMLIIPDPCGEIFYHTPTVRGSRIIAVMSDRVTEDYLQHLQAAGVSFVFSGAGGQQLRGTFQDIGRLFGIRSISLQGGGIINGALLKEGLLDELSLLVYPGVDGLSGVPSIMEYMGKPEELPAAGQGPELLSAQVKPHGAVWLRYRIHRMAG